MTAGRGAVALWLVLGLVACDLQPTSDAANPGAPYVLTSRGDPVRANAPPGVEVMLGAKRVLPAAEPVGLD